MGRRQEAKRALLNPDAIPATKRAEWDKLIAKSKAIVKQSDMTRWKLLLISEEVETEYGENLVARWAFECGISIRAAYEYRQLARYGVDKEFIGAWADKLSYTLIRHFVRSERSAQRALPALREALERKLREDDVLSKEQWAASWTDKEQEAVKEQLRTIGENVKRSVDEGLLKADTANRLEKAIINSNDKALIEQAAKFSYVDPQTAQELIDTGEKARTEDLMAVAEKRIKEFKKLHTDLSIAKNELIISVEFGHTNSEELAYRAHLLAKLLEEIATTVPHDWNGISALLDDDDVVEMP